MSLTLCYSEILHCNIKICIITLCYLLMYCCVVKKWNYIDFGQTQRHLTE